MIRGLYTSAQGMKNYEKSLNVVSNNLANVNTNGFKGDGVVIQSFNEVMIQAIRDEKNNRIGRMSLGVGVGEVYTNYAQGNVLKTDNPFDVAITNADLAFFCVDNNGAELYTRDGGFTLNAQGQLVTKDGNLVKGENGSITLLGNNISIGLDGTITEDGQVVDKILIKEFLDSKNFKKVGNNLLTTENGETKDFSGQIIQGSIELSNINSITEMVDIINIMRSYEANQKVLTSIDGTLDKAVNEIGRV